MFCAAERVESRPESREPVIERAAQPDRLRALPGKQERDLRFVNGSAAKVKPGSGARRRRTGDDALGVGEAGEELVAAAGDEPDARPALARARRERRGDVGDRRARRETARHRRRSSREVALEERGGRRRDHDSLRRAIDRGDGTATETDAAGAGASSSTRWQFVPPKPNELTAARRGRPAGASHGCSSVATWKPAAEREVRVRARRTPPAAGCVCSCEHQRRLDEAGDAGGAHGVADVRLHRREQHVDRARRARRAKNSRERADLDDVADAGRGAVRLDEADACRA